MKKFEFSKCEQTPESVFSGEIFYNVYKDSEFLRHSDHIETILSKGYELREMLRKVAPGERLTIHGMWLEKNSPLVVRKTGPNITIENYEFTLNRLTGIVAAFTFDNRNRFPIIKSSEAQTLGLTWDNNDANKCRLFLSAVSGTEHFYEQFLYFPLVCALRKFQLKKITLELVVKMAKIKNKNGFRMGQALMNNLKYVNIIWHQFPGISNEYDLKEAFNGLPPELRKHLSTKV